MIDKTRTEDLALLYRLRPHAGLSERVRIDRVIHKITHEEDYVRKMREEMLKQHLHHNLSEYRAMNDYINEYQERKDLLNPILHRDE